MNTPTLTARLIAAAAACITTLLLFSAVVSIAEPQRSELIAKNQRNHAPAATAVALASNAASRVRQ